MKKLAQKLLSITFLTVMLFLSGYLNIFNLDSFGTIANAGSYWTMYTHNGTNDSYIRDINHVYTTGEGINQSIHFRGYGKRQYKDFMLYDDGAPYSKIVGFDINESFTDYHTLEGAGFLLNVNRAGGGLNGYVLLYEQQSISLYKVNYSDIYSFDNGNYGNKISEGAVRIASSSKSAGSYHKIRIQNYVTSVVITDNGVPIINANIENTGGYAFGPIASYVSHGCDSQSSIDFSNIDLMTQTATGEWIHVTMGAPTLALTTSTQNWTNQDVVIYANATPGAGGNPISYMTLPNGQAVWTSSYAYPVADNGTYTFRVIDSAGAQTTESKTISNIDKVGPGYSWYEVKNVNQSGYDIYVYGVGDNASGINRVQFPTWTDRNGQDDIQTNWWTNPSASGENLGNGTWHYHVSVGAHNNEKGRYQTHVYIYDNAGNQTAFATVGAILDITPPTINLSYSQPAGWTNQNVIVTVNAIDTESGVNNIKLPDGQVVYNSKATFTVTKNGVYTFYSTDNVGNTSNQTITFDDKGSFPGIKIDKTPPEIDATYSVSAGWTKEDVIVNVTAKDSQSGVKNIILPDGTVVNSDKASFTVKKNGDYIVKSTDNAGNVGTKVITFDDKGTFPGIKIDKTPPTIAATYNVPKGWTKGNVKITVKATDTQSGVKNVILPDGTIVNGDTATYEVSENGIYIFKSTDNVGNIGVKKVIIGPSKEPGADDVKIDKNPPVLILTPSTTEPTNKDVTIYALAKDSESGVARIQLPNGTWVNDDNATFIATENGTYKFVSEDKVGNATEETITIDNIKRDKPDKPIIGPSGGTDPSGGGKPDIGGIDPDKWHDEDVPVVIPKEEVDDLEKNGSHIEYQVKDRKTGEVLQIWQKFIPEETEIDVQGDLAVDFVIVDKYGNVSDPTIIYVKIDKGSPIIKLIPSTVELTDKEVSIHVKADDYISKVEKVILPNGNVSIQTELDFTVNKNGLYEFTAIDSAGNKVTRNYLVRNIGRKPLITNNPNVILNLKSDDYLSGTTQMKFKNDDKTWTGYETYATSKKWTLSSPDGLKHVWVQYKDVANNESQPIEDIIILDTTPSTIDKFTINDGKYYTNNEVVNVQVKASDNLTGMDKLLVSNDGVNWTTIDYAENFKWTVPLGDGEKIVYLKVQDVAGNISKIYTAKVYLDKTKPTAGIIINNGDEYSVTRDVKLTINFQDGQSGIDKVRIIEDDREYEFPTVPNSPTTIDWTLGFGEHRTVSIQVIDKAGNASDLASDDIFVDKLKIEDFTLSDVVNPIAFNESNPYKPLTWNFEPQHMLAGANISFDLRVKLPIDEMAVRESASYKVEVIDDETGYHQVIMDKFTDVRKHVYSETITLPKDAPEGAKVFISCEAVRKMLVSPYDTQYDYFPGTEKSTKAQIGVIDKNIQEVIKFNEMR